MNKAESKERIRRECRERRASMDSEEWRSASSLIAENVAGIQEFREARTVMMYLSMNERREVDTAPLISLCASFGNSSLYVPVTRGETLCMVPFNEGDEVTDGRFGQPEPVSDNGCADVLPDVVILPVVAVDREGRRLGYGKGYYDRFIAGLRLQGATPFTLAVAFSFQLVSHVPEDPWDEKIDCVVTEKEVVRF
ncbi:MAG: 5-formyltetrahydrofolate cyclo-ligase [Chlorobium phaeobacteroides]|uniref:5-formyltetrahydrofolate cyclo-ligase n=1 Tax=Chlorobium phaeobacteroides (strain BS1) TaxID=331678 RepID=B3EJ50_CHLPB|nr:5-formyltetrahydrofolate cyclo-ligase [Chlorobium phaeobacteroides]MBL6956920.1 5-formyltetrahydrofolate cyclo-ligase [Chlorobium phaeobacteroides]